MFVITNFRQHLTAIKAWADAHQGKATLDVQSFELEVKANHRFYTFYPQFMANIEGRMAYAIQTSDDVTGFVSWLPYRPINWSLTQDKLTFKQRAAQASLSTPASWLNSDHTEHDFVLKSSTGSFGYELTGPYPAGRVQERLDAQAPQQFRDSGQVYAERFVAGTNLKVWFWGERAFHAHLHSYPLVTGDGRATALELVQKRLQAAGQEWASYADRPHLLSALTYQRVGLDSIPAAGTSLWLDYRYGRLATATATLEADNALSRLSAAQAETVAAMGRWAEAEIREELGPPVLYSVDGVIDADGQIWWLEMNSNPIFPPTGYDRMLSMLFGVQSATSAAPAPTQAPAAVAQPPVLVGTERSTRPQELAAI